MISLTGKNFIGFMRRADGKKSFQAFSPSENIYLPEKFTYASVQEFEAALLLAQKGFLLYKSIPAKRRAVFLDTIADEIMALGNTLIERGSAESGLSKDRITNERARTCNQLKQFAQLLRDGWWVDARIDTPQHDLPLTIKPDIRRMLIPVGPVAVYGASNFPLAFSTAGGDTASALAAGCPVIFKAHPSHPGTNELVASAIIKAAQHTQMPEGIFSSLYLSHEDSVKLVQHPVIKAAGFTGSRKVGMTLFHAAVNRPQPIPVYAEMSSINPCILLENALKTETEEIAKGLLESITLGAGQFCTNPGLILLVESETSAGFLNHLAKHLSTSLPGTMLNKNICQAYIEGIEAAEKIKNVQVLARSSRQADPERNETRPVIFTASAEEFLSNRQLSEETFGPASLVILNKDIEQLQQVLYALEGQLTATVHSAVEDEDNLKAIINIITEKAGRIIYNGFPTGVEVCHSMQHGGPFPSTTDAKSTSVGTSAIYRFLRPVAFQNIPEHLLPEALKNKNPLNILRLINGTWSNDAIR